MTLSIFVIKYFIENLLVGYNIAIFYIHPEGWDKCSSNKASSESQVLFGYNTSKGSPSEYMTSSSFESSLSLFFCKSFSYKYSCKTYHNFI